MIKEPYHTARYQRQMLLPELGEAGQQKLQSARILMIGAGGLGCPALQYLVAAGIGRIGIADHDVVDMTNLHRQILYKMADIGQSKAQRAKTILQEMNPDCVIEAYDLQLNNTNALSIIKDYDLVIDGTDNFATRYMINDACVLLDKPLIYGSIDRFEGQVAIFNVSDKNGQQVNYRHLFPNPPAPGEVLNCAEAGVIGVLPGIIGTMQASEAIKLITGIGTPLINQLFTYNALNNQAYTFQLPAEDVSNAPGDEAAFMAMNYDWFCGIPQSAEIEEINGETFHQWLHNDQITIIDVREPDETPVVDTFPHQQFPLSSLRDHLAAIEGDTIVIFCQSGKRSLKAAQMMKETFGSSRKIYSLRGGISGFLNQ